jgi:hypothetical protein
MPCDGSLPKLTNFELFPNKPLLLNNELGMGRFLVNKTESENSVVGIVFKNLFGIDLNLFSNNYGWLSKKGNYTNLAIFYALKCCITTMAI